LKQNLSFGNSPELEAQILTSPEGMPSGLELQTRPFTFEKGKRL
jgi:hypothetical protein